MAESTLTTIFEYDEHNLGESIKMFREYGLLDLFERMPLLLETLRHETEQHLATVPDALARVGRNSDLTPRWDAVLRVYMLLGAWQQFLMAAGHLFRGHVSDVFKHVRRAVEGAGIAYLSRSEPDLGDVFLSTDRRGMRRRTASEKLFPSGSPDQLLQRLGETFDYCSKQVHNNFSSFAARAATEALVGDDNRLHLQTQLALYEMENHGYVLGIAGWLLRAAEHTAMLLARAFDLPDCAWFRRLEQFSLDLDHASRRLRSMVQQYLTESAAVGKHGTNRPART